ncbi:MAG: ADP-ribosylglycohydrolase family protein [Desulfobacterota bacterium]|nr:ADP-ribosylglycohydrolase family protein [Thermodesulfobacteriota bacterium]
MLYRFIIYNPFLKLPDKISVVSTLRRFRQTGNHFAGASDPYSAGNRCIMRLAPPPMFFCTDLDLAELFTAEGSRTTPNAAECIDACRLLARIIVLRTFRQIQGRGCIGELQVILFFTDAQAEADRLLFLPE